MIFIGTRPWMVELLSEHLDMLPFLFDQRTRLRRHPRATLRDLLALEERIAAHTDGLVLAGDYALPLLRRGLRKPDSALASAYALLAMRRRDVAQEVWEALKKSRGKKQLALHAALCLGPTQLIAAALAQAAQGTTRLAPLSMMVLAHHGQTPKVDILLGHPQAGTRWLGWRIVHLLAEAAGIPYVLPESTYQAGLADGELRVAGAATLAAMCSGQQWIKRALQRRLAELVRAGIPDRAGPSIRRSWQHLCRLFALMSDESDRETMSQIFQLRQLGASRFGIIGACGRPYAVDQLLPFLRSANPREAIAAGRTFSRLIGQPIDSDQRVTLPPLTPGISDSEDEQPVAAYLPDGDRAEQLWQAARKRLDKSSYLHCGLDLSQGVSWAELASMDLRSRWEAWVRSRYYGLFSAPLIQHERLLRSADHAASATMASPDFSR